MGEQRTVASPLLLLLPPRGVFRTSTELCKRVLPHSVHQGLKSALAKRPQNVSLADKSIVSPDTLAANFFHCFFFIFFKLFLHLNASVCLRVFGPGAPGLVLKLFSLLTTATASDCEPIKAKQSDGSVSKRLLIGCQHSDIVMCFCTAR